MLKPRWAGTVLLVGLGEKMSGGQNPAYSYIFAGFLPTGCYLTAVALASYTLHCRLHFGIMTFNKETEIRYRGLTPHKITPMSGVLHAKSGLRVVLKWKIAGSGSVITDVIQLRVVMARVGKQQILFQ